MKIQKQDFFHGAALMQIVEHPSLKALNKSDRRYGHYLVNTDRWLFIKYVSKEDPPWGFPYHPRELAAIVHYADRHPNVFLCLVCGAATVCALDRTEMTRLIDIRAKKVQWIRVEAPPGGSMRVSGSRGRLQRTVAHNSFPGKVFQ